MVVDKIGRPRCMQKDVSEGANVLQPTLYWRVRVPSEGQPEADRLERGTWRESVRFHAPPANASAFSTASSTSAS